MNMLEHELLAGSRVRELRAQAEAASRARRLHVARRAARRAQRAIRRAARAGAAVHEDGRAIPSAGPGRRQRLQARRRP